MKIKYKLLLVFILIVSFTVIPLSTYIFNYEKKDKINTIVNYGLTNSRVLSQSIVNILLMNGGEISAAKIDSADMIKVLKPLKKNGLIYADAILVNPLKGFSGTVISKISFIDNNVFNKEIIDDKDIHLLISEEGFKKKYFNEISDDIYQFVSITNVLKTKSFCIGRIIFKQKIILKPIYKLNKIITLISIVILLIAILFSFLFSRSLTKPIEKLISEIEIIGSGDLTHNINIGGHIEIKKISSTINHLTRMLDLQVRQLVFKNKELQKLDKLKDEFLGNVTHELKTPLFGMIGIGESLIEGISGDIEESTKTNLELMISSGKRLSNLVNDILDYSQLKNGDITLKKTCVNLYSVFKYIIAITKPLYENKALIIYTDIPEDFYYIYADEDRLQQIMINLVSNAIKYTVQGEIKLSAEKYLDDDHIKISVSDTGIGISSEEQKHIFNSFEHSGELKDGIKKGYGLGLAITRKLVELHGGEILVDSNPGHGSVFYFTISRYIENESGKNIHDHELKEFKQLPNYQIDHPDFFVLKNEASFGNIMIIDDEPVNVQVLTNYLNLEGYKANIFYSAKEALKNIESGFEPDLIILDVMLPEMSGYEFCKKIRENFSAAELPILMLTAKNRISDIIMGFESGTNDYLTKPVNREELIVRVKSLLQLKNSIIEHNELDVINREMNIARNIQGSLLKSKIPENNNFVSSIKYIPMQKIGGDFYEIKKLSDYCYSIFIADVSGHGIPAAFISAMLKVIFSFYSKVETDPSTVMKFVNKTIYDYLKEQFITASYSIIDFKEKTLTYSNAGHWPVIIYNKDTGKLIYEIVSGMPFGCLVDEDYISVKKDIELGDRLFFYTDGIVESRNKNNEMFGKDNFIDNIKFNSGKSIDDLSDIIFDNLKKWILPVNKFDDDVTLIIIEILKFFE